MHIVEFAQKIDTIWYFSILAIVLSINILLFHKLAFNRYDPMWIMVITLSFQLTTPIYVRTTDKAIELEYVIYVALAILSFLIGAYTVQHLLKTRWTKRFPSSAQAMELDVTRWKWEAAFIYAFITCSTFLLAVAISIRALTVGLPIFSNNPEVEKLLVNRGGLGILERIIEPSVNCSLILIYYLARVKEKFTLKLAVYMIMPLIALLVSGSKGTLLTAYYTFYFTNVYISLREHKRFKFVSFRIVIVVAIAVLAYAAFVLATRARGSGISNINDFVAQTLVTRFIAFSDGIYYFFTYGGLYNQISYGITDYFYQYWMVPLLAPLRLISYPAQSLGNQILATKLGGQWIGGPNPTMSVEGFIFFGFGGGLVYCFCLGMLFSFCRGLILKTRNKNSFRALLLFCIGNLIALKITGDMTLFTASLFDYFTIATLTFIIGCLLYTIRKYEPLFLSKSVALP